MSQDDADTAAFDRALRQPVVHVGRQDRGHALQESAAGVPGVRELFSNRIRRLAELMSVAVQDWMDQTQNVERQALADLAARTGILEASRNDARRLLATLDQRLEILDGLKLVAQQLVRDITQRDQMAVWTPVTIREAKHASRRVRFGHRDMDAYRAWNGPENSDKHP